MVVVLVRDEMGALIGCAPLGTLVWHLRPLSVRVLGFACPRYCDYSDFLVRSDRAKEALTE